MVVDDRGSCGGASVNGLQGLLLTFVSCKYNDWAGIKCRGHSVEDRRRDHGRFIYNYEVVFVNPVIDVIRMRPVNGYVEGRREWCQFQCPPRRWRCNPVPAGPRELQRGLTSQ